jgi:hypothetical protein
MTVIGGVCVQDYGGNRPRNGILQGLNGLDEALSLVARDDGDVVAGSGGVVARAEEEWRALDPLVLALQ